MNLLTVTTYNNKLYKAYAYRFTETYNWPFQLKIHNEDTDMYANIVKYSKESAIIRLENNVKIIRDGETITGDYGTLNTNNNSYKVKSKDSKKVKVIILETDE